MTGRPHQSGDAFCFINVNVDGANTAPNVSREALGLVRSHAMRAVRRRPKEDHNQNPVRHRPMGSGSSSQGRGSSGIPTASADRVQDGYRIQRTAVGSRDQAGPVEASEEIISIPPHAVYRTALAAACHYSFMGVSMARMSSDLAISMRMKAAGHTSIEKLVQDSMLLLHCGKANSDERVVLKARKLQLVGVQRLRIEVQSLRDPSSVLSAAQMLLLSELYTDRFEGSNIPLHMFSMAPVEEMTQLHSRPGRWKSWYTHLHAMAAVIRQNNDPGATSNLRPFLLHQYRHSSLMYSLLNRVCVVDEQAWEICCSHGNLLPAVEELFSLAIRLVKLLECIAACHLQASSNRELANLCTRTSEWRDLDNDYEQWLLRFGRAMALSHNSNGLSEAINTVPEHVDACMTSKYLETTCQSFYWTCLLILRQSLLEHWRQHHEEFIHFVVEAKTSLCAKHIRDLVEHHLHTRDGVLSKVLAVRAPLYFAFKWFELSKDGPNLRWCKSTETALRVEVPFVNWDAALLWSFLPLHCLS